MAETISLEGDPRFQSIAAIITEFSRGNLDYRVEPSPERDGMDAIMSGLGMLGEELRHTMVHRDEYRGTQQELRDARDTLQGFLDNAHDIIQTVDPAGRITYVNKAWERVLGYDREEIIGRSLFEFIHPDTLEECEETFYDVLRYSRDRAIESVLVSRSGESIIVSGSAYCFYKDDRPSMVHSIFRDVTRERLATKALRKSESMLAEAQNVARLGNWEWKPGERQAYWSHQVFHILGFPPKSTRTSIRAALGRIHSGDCKQLLNTLRDLNKGKRTEASADYRLLRRDGSIRFVNSRMFRMEEDDGAVKITGIVQDITDRKHMEEALQVAGANALKASQAKSEFLARMSHELRTPLNAILGFAQLLNGHESVESPQQRAEYLKHILHSGEHLLELINEVLELSRIESGSLSLSMEKIRAGELIAEVIRLVQPMANVRNIVMEKTSGMDRLIKVDRTRFKQILMNLLSNAIKYNSEGGRVGVTMSAGQSRQLRISVSDTGPGIPPERQAALFTPFDRLGAEHTSTEGTGIGLTIARKLIQLLDGEIGFESGPTGTTFWLELDALDDELSSDEGTQAQARDRGSRPNHATNKIQRQAEFKVLYIEDNQLNTLLMQRTLDQIPGVSMLHAQVGEEGVAMARAHQPDLILVDIHLPDIDGYQVLEKLKADAATRAIRTVAVSADAMPSDIERAYESGFAEYITKPIHVRKTVDRIRDLLGPDQGPPSPESAY